MLQTSSMSWLLLAVGVYAGSLIFFLLKQKRFSVLLLAAGFLPHTVYLILRGWHYGVFTPLNFFTEQYFLPWCIAGTTLYLKIRRKDAGNALTLLFPICLFSIIALILPQSTPQPSPTTATILAVLFFLSEVVAHALFVLGGWFALLFLLGREEQSRFNTCAIWGFIMYSLAQVVGGVWSYLGWTVPFHWSERHLLSAALWCFYCAYLHLHFSSRWSTKGKAIFALCGALLMFIFTYAYFFASMGVKNA
jgi:ABC-type transport system involved in cytochrome c biogenesis permease subunit